MTCPVIIHQPKGLDITVHCRAMNIQELILFNEQVKLTLLHWQQTVFVNEKKVITDTNLFTTVVILRIIIIRSGLLWLLFWYLPWLFFRRLHCLSLQKRDKKYIISKSTASLELPSAYRAVEVKKLMLTLHLQLLATAWSICTATTWSLLLTRNNASSTSTVYWYLLYPAHIHLCFIKVIMANIFTTLIVYSQILRSKRCQWFKNLGDWWNKAKSPKQMVAVSLALAHALLT